MTARWKAATARAIAAMVLAGPGCAAGAQADGGAWDEAASLRELPAGIQALLGVGLGGGNGIADPGEGFNVGAVAADNTPMRRFAFGIVNGNTTVVAVEAGGRAYAVQVLEFHRDGATWAPARCTARASLPQRGADLLAAFTAPAADLAASCRMVDGHVATAPARPQFRPQLRQRPGA